MESLKIVQGIPLDIPIDQRVDLSVLLAYDKNIELINELSVRAHMAILKKKRADDEWEKVKKDISDAKKIAVNKARTDTARKEMVAAAVN